MCPPACRNCGRDMALDDGPQPMQGRSVWKRTCACVFPPRPEYAASDQDVAQMRAFLSARGLPGSDDFARHSLSSLADTRTKLVVAMSPGDEITITFDEAVEVLGHDL
jgi:hypothetical protein